jgi:S-adenosylmethionine/arginine decarboxylase-like enzyme
MPAKQLIQDFKGCTRKDRMRRGKSHEEDILGIIRSVGMTVESYVVQPYPGDSYTIAVVVSESHVILHMWPDEGVVNADVFFCNFNADNSKKGKHVLAAFRAFYGATSWTRCRRVTRLP